MLSPSFEFPDVYTDGNAPAATGVRVPNMRSSSPCYRYGWLVSRAELYEAIHGEPAFRDIYLTQIYIGAGQLLHTRWTEKGYDTNEYNPEIPGAKHFNAKYVVIFMACNDSDAIIKSIMENKKLHEECRDCLGSPKTMESEAVWIRVGIWDFPKELSATVHGADSNVDQ